MTTAPRGIDHVALNVTDVPAAISFYTESLGLTQRGDRPDFGIDGAWLDAGEQQVHLIELPAPPTWASISPSSTTTWAAWCHACGRRASRSAIRSASSPGRHQAFVNDPWGNTIELHQRDQRPDGRGGGMT